MPIAFPDPAWRWWPVLAGPFAGSVLGVLVDRLPDGRPVAFARSACRRCGHVLGPAELVPLLSFLAQRGRCRHCAGAIGGFAPMVELAATAVAGLAAAVAPDAARAWCGGALGWGLLAAAWVDWRSLLLPDALTLPLVLLGLAACVWLAPDALADHALGAAAGYAALAGLALAYRRLRGREGLGGGDAKLLAASGAWLGWQSLSDVLLAAALAGLAGAGIARLAGRRVHGATRLPFGPCLALATFAAWCWSGGGE